MSSVTGWRKSSLSFANGNCVEVAPGSTWGKSSRSIGNGNCVEASRCACAEPGILVRDSKLGDASPVLSFSAASWAEFTAAIRLP